MNTLTLELKAPRWWRYGGDAPDDTVPMWALKYLTRSDGVLTFTSVVGTCKIDKGYVVVEFYDEVADCFSIDDFRARLTVVAKTVDDVEAIGEHRSTPTTEVA